MKREILFRGKRKLNGDWVYGSLISIGDDWCQIIPKGTEYDEIQSEMTRVITSTLGQFTGLTDKNGTKIFEDDKTSNGYVIMWSHKKSLFCEHYQLIFDSIWSEASYPIQAERIEITGNIHENK